jgi:isoleucyl-tRNA synthetase
LPAADIKSRDDVMAMGIDKYNEECRSIVMRYSKEWEAVVGRLGRWIDFEVGGWLGRCVRPAGWLAGCRA